MTSGKLTTVKFDQTRHRLLTEQQMRDTELRAIHSGQVTGLSMMEAAGNGVVEALSQSHPQQGGSTCSAIVLCGPGNNGGDGYVIARHLRKLKWRVDIYHYGDIEKLPPDAAENARLWLQTGDVRPLSELTQAAVSECDVVVDALFGTGLVRPLADDLVDLLDMAAIHARHVIAVDMPSGVSANSGLMLRSQDRASSAWPRADHIVTFQRMKPGHLFLPENMAGTMKGSGGDTMVTIVDLGIAQFEPSGPRAFDNSAGSEPDVHTGGIPEGLHKPNLAHKYQHGHAVICAGGVGHGGAGRLAARAALRVGAGAATLACPSEALAENAAQLNAIMLSATDTARELLEILGDTRKNALCLGPGMGRGARTREFVRTALESRRAIVLDADALTSFEDNPSELFSNLHEKVVLTPHGGEFARLFPDLTDGGKSTMETATGRDLSQMERVVLAAQTAGCCVLLKGAVTIIATPQGRVELSAALGPREVPWLATAGAGDVLAGFITGLMARGFAAMEAARAGAWLHVECARLFGPGLIAEDLPDMLPRLLRRLETGLQPEDGFDER
jgi:hydroxyethylthiazole kinase-like uncharacterized protein yjeF